MDMEWNMMKDDPDQQSANPKIPDSGWWTQMD